MIDNPALAIRHFPLEAYDYVVNGKPALKLVMESQSVTTDKKSGIVNDANDTINNAEYPLEMLLRVITVKRGSEGNELRIIENETLPIHFFFVPCQFEIRYLTPILPKSGVEK
ncbi:MAG: type ISP restriction/modification enzyme [Verrucomicrobiales bacterium]